MGVQGLLRRLAFAVMVLTAIITPVLSGAAEGSTAPETDLARPAWDTRGMVRWYHSLPGDFNQDGLVNGSDLTQFGLYFDLAASDGSFRVHSELSLIDGNRDGRITSADMTTIGVHYNNDVLGGYNVYASQSLADYPAGNTAPSEAQCEAGGQGGTGGYADRAWSHNKAVQPDGGSRATSF